jgi:hypothetical protein
LLFTVPGPGNRAVSSALESGTYQNTRKLLSAMGDVRRDNDKLAALFKVGDERIQDLIRALDDPDSGISLRAQIVIRYLGSAEGLKGLTEWYRKQPNGHPIAGPIPLPLSDWDYNFINTNLIGKPAETWREIGVRYIYALAIDDSQQSKRALDAMMKNASTVNGLTFLGQAINQIRSGRPMDLITGKKDPAKLVLNNAFFVSPEDRKHARARLLGFNGKKDKALVEVYINRGRLAEEWYHVVIRKHGEGWKFFSITQVAVS